MSGKCPRCPYKVRLRKDGTVGSHILWIGPDHYHHCEGAGQQPREMASTSSKERTE